MSCYKCDLSITRKYVVLGLGNKIADTMLIGEAPGYNEDKSGVPFIGDSGKYIRELLINIGYSEENMFITNVVKCRPPKNRTPDSSEISICTKHFLFNEIQVVNPIFIITAGKVATSVILNKDVIMKDYVDKYFKIGKRWVLPIYHPSHILQNESMKEYYPKSIANIKDSIERIKYYYLFDIIADFNMKV